MSDQINYEAVLNDLRARRDQLSIAIAAIEQLGKALTEGLLQDVVPSNGNSLPAREAPVSASSIASDAFFKLSVPDAARKYLSIIKRPAGAKEIEKALREGGFQTKAKNFYANLYTSLVRSEGTFEKVGKKWGLAEWYPQGGRAKSAEEGED
jgi:hypothetical protein